MSGDQIVESITVIMAFLFLISAIRSNRNK